MWGREGWLSSRTWGLLVPLPVLTEDLEAGKGTHFNKAGAQGWEPTLGSGRVGFRQEERLCEEEAQPSQEPRAELGDKDFRLPPSLQRLD